MSKARQLADLMTNASVDGSGNVTFTNTVTAASLDVGGWALSQDGSNNIVFSNGGSAKAKISTTGFVSAADDIGAFETL